MKSRRLSQAQLRVAELVAQGQSNPEVAAVLDLSPKTVEWHLSHVYRKLGVGRRGELAAALGGGTPLGRASGEVEPCGPLPKGSASEKYGLQPRRGEVE